MDKLSDIMRVLNEAQFTSATDNGGASFTFEGKHLSRHDVTALRDIRVEVRIETMTSIRDIDRDYPLQVLLLVYLQGGLVQRWGCDSNEMNTKVLRWAYKQYSETLAYEMRKEDERDEMMTQVWNALK